MEHAFHVGVHDSLGKYLGMRRQEHRACSYLLVHDHSELGRQVFVSVRLVHSRHNGDGRFEKVGGVSRVAGAAREDDRPPVLAFGAFEPPRQVLGHRFRGVLLDGPADLMEALGPNLRRGEPFGDEEERAFA